MISKKDILTMVRKVTRTSKGYKERKLMNPHRDWLIGVAVFLIIALAGGILNARSYVYYNTIESRVTEDTVPVKKYRANDAEMAIERYEARADTFESLANEFTAPAVEQGTSTATSSDATPGDSEVVDDSAEDSATSSALSDADAAESATTTTTE